MIDDFGDRMKMYERMETDRVFLPSLPVYARIDGRSFSRFTKGMERPFDRLMSACMARTTAWLVEGTHAKIGYTQSDEISLIWHAPDPKSEIFFKGKIQKMCSVLSGMATSYFMSEIMKTFPNRVDEYPHFDCRVFQLPSLHEAANTILWRERDATKNAISMAARHYYSHKELQGKNSIEMQLLLLQQGVNFNEYPDFFKRGTFLQRRTNPVELSEEILNKIPEGRRPEGPILRSKVEMLEMPPFNKVKNRVGVIFNSEDPELIE